MSTTRSSPPVLGRCPECETEIHRYNVIIEYEDANGDQAVWAECPNCREVVDPA